MTPMSAPLLMAALVREGVWHAVPGGRLVDAAYAPPRSDWVLGDFARWYQLCLPRLGLATYAPEQADCDDYAQLYCALARVCHRGTPIAKRVALPVGPVHYSSATLGAHAIAGVLTSDLGLIFVDPQRPTGRVLLTPAERASAWLFVI